MSPSPLIVFSAFESTADPRLQGWATFRQSVQTGSFATATAPEAPARPRARAPGVPTGHSGIWRLLAPNSRELGRSSSVYGSFSGARAHVLELKTVVEDMVATTVTGPVAGTHGWMIAVGGVVVMTSGRWYGAGSSSREAAFGTIEAFRKAVVAEDARYSPGPGRRGNMVLTEEERASLW
ncbi:hypothetical protein [Cryobacterium mannosilyticum]|uniref:Uncharacterized protein n=1 Tax=Cryobacterium mannosilyticum TaxID=1259190 RepID=A0A4R8W214_9MICO|nr:hypothetical protein [Cryobacterium mannosilyticum]TFB99952.1 hypothetical protein E3O32_16055 [Cryobacterium mannosilyticum]